MLVPRKKIHHIPTLVDVRKTSGSEAAQVGRLRFIPFCASRNPVIIFQFSQMLSYGLSAYASVMGGKISLEELVLEFLEFRGSELTRKGRTTCRVCANLIILK